MAGKAKCSWEPRKSMLEPFFWQSASFFFLLAGRIFMWRMSLTRALAKVGKDYSMLIYVLALCGSAGACPDALKAEGCLLAKGYHQYGMMFVFAVTVVMVAVYANARACLKNHSRKL